MMSDIAIQVTNVSKKFRLHHERRNSIYEAITGFLKKDRYYENLQVLDNVSFDVKKGEMVGIIGRNGAGKTTILRLLSGIYQPDSGTIKTDGTVIPFLGLGLGFNPELTARDNIIIYGRLLGFSKKKIEEKEEEIVKFAELERFEDTKIKNFSSGMAARLAFATAVQVDPDIILVDEILSVGDIAFQKKSYETFLSFKERKKSIVVVTHNMDIIRKDCDRAMFLDEGKIKMMGEPEKVIEFYVNESNK
ncbi:MAG: ABC transporter ATP-binding protein [Patescibacteria group bacterium]|nr:ABC transporter ATP-binding protein [Patescibacteria group bacterium]